jgi:hypothetical protein
MCCDGFISVPVIDNPVNTALDVTKNINDTVNNAVDNAGTVLDNAVNNNIPGGWATVGAAALAAATMGGSLVAEGAVGAADAAAMAAPAELDATGTLAATAADTGAGGAGALAGTDAGLSAIPTATDTGLSMIPPEEIAPTPTGSELDPTGSLAQQANPSYLQQLQNAYSTLPTYAQGALSGAGKGMVTNAGISLLTGRPITAQGLLQAGLAGGVGGGIADVTDSNFLGGLGAVSTNALLNKSLNPTTMASAIPNIGAGIYNLGSSGNTSGSSGSNISSPSTAQTANINAIEPTTISTGSGLQTGPVLKNTKILHDLKEMYPQLNDVDPRLLSQLGYDVGGNLPTESVNTTQTSNEPTFDEKNANMYKTILAGGDANPLQHFRDGGMPHVPEFITGATGHYVKGRGDGQSDDIPAMLADGEYVFDADTVAQLGNGSSDAGAKLLDHFRQSLREHKRSAPSDKIPPVASPLVYMKEALNRHGRK